MAQWVQCVRLPGYRIEGLTRARVTQIMNLLKLPAEMQDFLLGLDDAKQIRKYSERKLRGYHK